MDFPEVWSFEHKEKRLQPETFPAGDNAIGTATSKIPFAHLVSILIPETDTKNLEAIINDSDFYSCEDFRLSDILVQTFVEGFLQNGVFNCVALEDNHFKDTFAINNNKLSMKIHKDSLQSVQATALNSFKSNQQDEFQCFNIDLLDVKDKLPKLSKELENIFTTTRVNLTWTPKSSEICSSSIAKYLTDAGRAVKQIANELDTQQEFGLKFPDIPESVDELRLLEISEYVGLVMLGCSVEENEFSSYRLPDDCSEIGRGKVLHGKGFFTCDALTKLVSESHEIVKENPQFPWIALAIVSKSGETVHSKVVVVSKDKIFRI